MDQNTQSLIRGVQCGSRGDHLSTTGVPFTLKPFATSLENLQSSNLTAIPGAVTLTDVALLAGLSTAQPIHVQLWMGHSVACH